MRRWSSCARHDRRSDANPPPASTIRPASTVLASQLPDGKRVAVFIVVNVEDWDIARAMPRQVLTAPQGASVVPDLPNWAWHEYGMRVGFWRLKAALDAHGIAPSMTINGTVPAAYPRVTQAARDAGWEFMGHGFRQIATHLVEDQRAMIRDAIAALREAGGHDIVGWLAPGLTETLETPDLLAEAGIRYCADWVVDDLPCTLRTAHGPLLTMPYSVELNDIPMMMIQHHAARELFDRTVAQFDRLYAEAETQGAKVMGLAVHPYISGVPHRIGWFEQALALYGSEARHAVLAGAADHGLVSAGNRMNWGAHEPRRTRRGLQQPRRGDGQRGAARGTRDGIGSVPRRASGASRSALRSARAQHMGSVSGEGPEGAVHGVHPWRLLAAQQQGPVRQSDRRPAMRAAGRRRCRATPWRPTRRSPRSSAEIRAALDWLAEHGPAHGIDGPIVLSGWSAGGHLTAMCLEHPAWPPGWRSPACSSLDRSATPT